MPRPGPRRPAVCIRLSPQGLEWIDDRAKKNRLSRSEMIRIMLKYASTTMPEGWR